MRSIKYNESIYGVTPLVHTDYNEYKQFKVALQAFGLNVMLCRVYSVIRSFSFSEFCRIFDRFLTKRIKTKLLKDISSIGNIGSLLVWL